MAIQQTQNLPAPWVDTALKGPAGTTGQGFLDQIGKVGTTPTTGTMGLPSIAGESAFTQQARKTGAEQAGFTYDPTAQTLTAADYGAGAGVSAYEPYLTKAATYADPTTTAGASALQGFLSPQQTYIEQAMQDAATKAKTGLDAQALQSGAFGGGRHGIAGANIDSELIKQIGLMKENTWQQGLQNMFQGQGLQSQLANQTQQLGMADTAQLGQLGAGQLGYEQAV